MFLAVDCTVGMLKVNPEERPTINDIVDRLHEIASVKGVNLREPLGLNKETPTSAPGETEMDRCLILYLLCILCFAGTDFAVFSQDS